MCRLIFAGALLGLPHTSHGAPADADEAFRPPAVPLIVHDPYFSIWSRADRLTDVDTTHWTGKPHPLTGMVWVDEKGYRVMGAEPADVPALLQTSVNVLPTRTIYKFANDKIRLTLTFLTPILPDDLDLLSRPLTYIIWDVESADGDKHLVRVYLDVSALLAVNTPDQLVDVEEVRIPGLRPNPLRMGSKSQAVLERRGDDVRIDWGHLWLAIARGGGGINRIFPVENDGTNARAHFARTGSALSPLYREHVIEGGQGLGLAATPGSELLGGEPARMVVMIAYDDLYSIRYFSEDLRPYWRRDKKWAAESMLMDAASRFEELEKRCKAFDEELMADLERLGGPGYAKLCALAYRQSFGATKLVADAAGKPLFFTKECHSNGCIGTVDVFYPQSPQCLFFSPALMKATVVPILDYASSPRWKFPFAPHDLGQYPHATGQVYGGGEKSEKNQMMVEESANMLLLVAAIAEAEGKMAFAERYWPLLEKWAAYLEAKGFDPENQLCTDDFAGHLAHNVNLSAKAIVALGAFGKLCEKRGLADDAKRYGDLAKSFAARWLKEADDGDHFRLAFDKPGTWSQKYNLVWDRVLNLGLFPEAALQKEVEYYRKVQAPFGLPLDSRQTYTKLDWILWSAAITGDRDDFEAIMNPVLKFLNETPDRFPMTDWYFTDTAKRRGFTARPVVGGVFMYALGDRELWRKWAGRGANVDGPWAPLPLRPTKAPEKE